MEGKDDQLLVWYSILEAHQQKECLIPAQEVEGFQHFSKSWVFQCLECLD